MEEADVRPLSRNGSYVIQEKSEKKLIHPKLHRNRNNKSSDAVSSGHSTGSGSGRRLSLSGMFSSGSSGRSLSSGSESAAAGDTKSSALPAVNETGESPAAASGGKKEKEGRRSKLRLPTARLSKARLSKTRKAKPQTKALGGPFVGKWHSEKAEGFQAFLGELAFDVSDKKSRLAKMYAGLPWQTIEVTLDGAGQFSLTRNNERATVATVFSMGAPFSAFNERGDETSCKAYWDGKAMVLVSVNESCEKDKGKEVVIRREVRPTSKDRMDDTLYEEMFVVGHEGNKTTRLYHRVH